MIPCPKFSVFEGKSTDHGLLFGKTSPEMFKTSLEKSSEHRWILQTSLDVFRASLEISTVPEKESCVVTQRILASAGIRNCNFAFSSLTK